MQHVIFKLLSWGQSFLRWCHYSQLQNKLNVFPLLVYGHVAQLHFVGIEGMLTKVEKPLT